MNKTLLHESPDGMIYRIEKIPSGMFEFFILQKREFKDGTKSYDIGVSPTANTSKGFIFDRIRGHRSDAIKRLDQIIKNYKP